MLLFEVPLLIRQLKWLAAKEQRQYTEVNQKSEV
ncbi:hypothetical protein AMURIS_02926 [Acetatifactor muris]|uniref:Uncharacterized protein n=1 Tax=Acetatifactor muris TaxID=879566 RepID=A0A2K4ZI83_9FIRM|nr:hypothetical protein AMURIS_02926 [Acetatifactor muris]